jgi:hypothetical protein
MAIIGRWGLIGPIREIRSRLSPHPSHVMLVLLILWIAQNIDRMSMPVPLPTDKRVISLSLRVTECWPSDRTWLRVELNFQYYIYSTHGKSTTGKKNPKYHYRCKFEPEAKVEIMEGAHGGGAWRGNLCGRGEGDGDDRGRRDDLAATRSRRASSNARRMPSSLLRQRSKASRAVFVSWRTPSWIRWRWETVLHNSSRYDRRSPIRSCNSLPILFLRARYAVSCDGCKRTFALE